MVRTPAWRSSVLSATSTPRCMPSRRTARGLRTWRILRRVGRSGSATPTSGSFVARWGDELIGFSFGHQLPVQTGWWDGALTPLPDGITTEYSGRTFAIIEMAVRRRYRRRGVARRLHGELTAGRPEERITLLVRPDAPAPWHAYRSWGYQPVGRIQPFPEGPGYDSMIKPCIAAC